jgi:hypothetical protein
MDIELFDKRYVYLEWSDELEGKDCILAKTYQDLKDFVNSGDESRFCKANKGREKPFTNIWSECDFCYYDPNLKVKKAWIEGKTIQKRDLLNEWEDYIDTERISLFFYNIKWDAHEWRVKPTEETWYVIFAEDSFLRVTLITNLNNTVFFKGTYEECGKWIDEHKSYAKILFAWKHGKIIQYKVKTTNNNWSDWVLEEYPRTDSFEICDWRIKPTTEEIINYTNETSREPIYILNMHKKDKSEFEFTMSEHDSFSPIYVNTRKKCQYVLNTVVAKFTDKCVGCKGNSCFNCKPLQDFIKNIKFTRRMTNKELAEYLVKGNGEMKTEYFSLNALKFISTVYTSYSYLEGTENEEIGSSILIRDFGSDEWRQPLIEV